MIEQLTQRERQVLALLVQGKTNREIGQVLVLATGTVKGHASTIFGKLGVANRTEATRVAQHLGLVAAPDAISPVAQTIATLLEFQPDALDELREAGVIENPDRD